jgi:hypothetical protein
VRLLVSRRALAAVTAEGPAHSECGIKPVRAIGSMKVCGPKQLCIAAQVVHLVLGGAQLEVTRQLKSDAHGTIEGDRFHGCGVSHLRDISSKAHPRLDEKKEMPCGGPAKRLKLDITTDEIARVGRTSGSRTSRTGRLRKRATAKVRLVMRRRHVIVDIAADPVLGEKSARRCRRFCDVGGIKGVCLGARWKSENCQESKQNKKCFLHGVPTSPKRDLERIGWPVENSQDFCE